MGFWFGWLGDPRLHILLIISAMATMQPTARSAYLALGHTIDRFERLAQKHQAKVRDRATQVLTETHLENVDKAHRLPSQGQP